MSEARGIENRFIYFSTVWHSLNALALDIFAQFDSHDLFSRAMNTSIPFHYWSLYNVRIASHSMIDINFYRFLQVMPQFCFMTFLPYSRSPSFIRACSAISIGRIYTFYLIHFLTLSINHKYNSVQERFCMKCIRIIDDGLNMQCFSFTHTHIHMYNYLNTCASVTVRIQSHVTFSLI